MGKGRAVLQNIKDNLQRDFKIQLFGYPPVPNNKGILKGGKPPDMKRLAKVLSIV